MATPYDTDLDRNAANFQPLTPLSFLARATDVYPDQTAIVHGMFSPRLLLPLAGRSECCSLY
jgi:hypothetical protein